MFRGNFMPMQVEEKIYQIALSQVRGVGYVLAKKLMARFGPSHLPKYGASTYQDSGS
jgi:hypothetical protein